MQSQYRFESLFLRIIENDNDQYLFSFYITLDFDKGSTVSSSRALDRKSSKAGIKNEDIDQFLMVTRI